MKYFLLILIALGLSVTACSKKSSSAAAPPPVTDDDDYYQGGGYDGEIWSGPVTIYNQTTYQNFLNTAFGYQYNQQYNYNVSCNLDVLRWVFGGGQIVDCDSGNNSMYNLTSAPALVELLFKENNRVEGLWVVNPQYNGYEIPFAGVMTRYSDGRFLIEAGALALLTTMDSSGNVREDNFDTYYIWYDNYNRRYSSRFGNVTIR
jgi:hypothetical protein